MDELRRLCRRWTETFWRWLAACSGLWFRRAGTPAAPVEPVRQPEVEPGIQTAVVLREVTPPGIARMAALLDGWAYEQPVRAEGGLAEPPGRA